MVVELLGAGCVNFISARLEALLAGKAQKETIISAFQAQLQDTHLSHSNLFINLYHKAIQGSKLELDYTQPLDQLVQTLEQDGDIQRLLENAIAPSPDFDDYRAKLVKKVTMHFIEHNYTLPDELGGNAEQFIAQLYQFMIIFIELITPNTALKQYITALKQQLTKPNLPLSANPIEPNIEQPHNFFHKYKYDRRLVKFEANDKIQATLKRFCYTQQSNEHANIQIMALYGRAGSGKSRTALEWCLQLQWQATPWHAGFISNEHAMLDMSQYTWQRPTFIVFDYAANRLEQLHALVCSLKACHQQQLLQAPIRILLLERQCSPEQGWLKQLLEHYANISPYFTLADDCTPLHLEVTAPKLKQSEQIIKNYANAMNMDCDEQRLAHIQNTATRIENGEPRPLILQVVSELLLKDDDQRYQSIEQILEALFKNEERLLNKSSIQADLKTFWQLIALATLSGGVNLSELSDLALNHPIVSELVTEQNWQLAQQFFGNTANGQDYYLPNLEPDLLGEYAITRTWRQWQSCGSSPFANIDEPSARDKLLAQLALAFTLNSDACAESLARTCLDFDENNLLLNNSLHLELQQQWQQQSHPALQGYCDYLCYYFEGVLDREYKQGDAKRYYTAWQHLNNCYHTAYTTRLAVTTAFFAAVASEEQVAMSLAHKQKCLTELSDIAKKINRSSVYLLLAQGLVNIITHSAPQDLILAKGYVTQLSNLAGTQNSEPVCLELAKGLVNIINHSAPKDLALAKEYVTQLSNLAGTQNSERVWLGLAQGLVNIIADSAPQDLALAKGYVTQLSDLANTQNHEPIWLELAKGLVNIIADSAPKDLALAKQYLNQLIKLAVAQANATNASEINLLKGKAMLATSYFWITGKPNTGGEELLVQAEQEFAGSELQTLIHQIKAELGSAGGTS